MERLADQLVAVNENAFVHGSTDSVLYGGRPNTDDWTISAGTVAAAAPAAGGGGDDEGEGGGSLSAYMEIDVAPAGRLPFQEASLQVLSAADPPPGGAGGSEEGQPIEGLDLGTLEAYVGVAGATVIKPAVSTPTAAAAGTAAAALGAAAGGLSRMETGLSDMSNPLDLGDMLPSARGHPGGSEGSPEVASRPGRDETAAQAAARAEFRRDTAGGWGEEQGAL